MSYVVDLEAFHGPLDLLLYLIEKNEVDIYDIPIAQISRQFMEHLRLDGHYDLEIIGDFLLLASYLLHLKALLLLPKPAQAGEDGQESGDPREELVEKLLAYKKYKEAAEFLAQRENVELGMIFYRTLPPEAAEEKTEVIADIWALRKMYHQLLSRPHQKENTFETPLKDVDIGEKMREIMHCLKENQPRLFFAELLEQAGNRREALALFLALLELVRLQKIKVVQDQEFSGITIYTILH